MSDPQPPYGEPAPPWGEQPPPPPGAGQPAPPYQPYGQAQPYTAPANPAYGYGYGQPHGGATTALALGIVSIVVAVVGCCVSSVIILPVGALAAFIGPFGIYSGAKARREIDAAPQLYSNRSAAVGGLACSIIGTALGVITLVITLIGVLLLGLAFSSWNY